MRSKNEQQHFDASADLIARELVPPTIVKLGNGFMPEVISPEERRRRERQAHEATKATIWAEGCGTQRSPEDDWRHRQTLQQAEIDQRAAELSSHTGLVTYSGSK